jgi:hypothetical protein
MAGLHRIAALLLLATSGCIAPAAAWTHDAYVWQRQPSPALAAALRSSRDHINTCCLLASEISWHGDAPRITRPRLDHAALAALGKPIALALRINPLPPKTKPAGHASQIAAEAAAILSAARAAGIVPVELQIDYDCPEHKLAPYRELLRSLRAAAGQTPLTFTALPAWLKHAEDFTALAREADGFVLQVHSLEKPASIDSAFTLCDPARALDWARRADALAARAGPSGARFRVALPTYGYTLGFDAEGRFIGLAAEAPRDWPAGTRLRAVRANPRELQRLARELSAENLARLDGIIWFRLPVAGDRLAWNAETLAAVIRDTPIVSRLSAEIHRTQPGLAEIVIINRGQTAEPLPQTLRVTWTPKGRATACDTLAGYYCYYERHGDNVLVVYRHSLAPAELAPGRSRAVGWLRFDFPDEKTASAFSIHATIP